MNIDYLCSPYTNTERNNKKNEKIINNNLDADHHDDQHDGSTCPQKAHSGYTARWNDGNHQAAW